MVNLRPRKITFNDEEQQRRNSRKTPKKEIAKRKGPEPKKNPEKPTTSDSERTELEVPIPKRPRTTTRNKKLVVESEDSQGEEVVGPHAEGEAGDKTEESQSPARSYDLSKGGEAMERPADDEDIDALLKSDFLRTGEEEEVVGNTNVEVANTNEEVGNTNVEVGNTNVEVGNTNVEVGNTNEDDDDLIRGKGDEVQGEVDESGESARSTKRRRTDTEDEILKRNFLKNREKSAKTNGEAVKGGNIEKEAGLEKEAEGSSGLKEKEAQVIVELKVDLFGTS